MGITLPPGLGCAHVSHRHPRLMESATAHADVDVTTPLPAMPPTHGPPQALLRRPTAHAPPSGRTNPQSFGGWSAAWTSSRPATPRSQSSTASASVRLSPRACAWFATARRSCCPSLNHFARWPPRGWTRRYSRHASRAAVLSASGLGGGFGGGGGGGHGS